jgi:hypothetical protein
LPIWPCHPCSEIVFCSLVDLTVHLTHYLDNPQEKIPIKSIICNENYSDMEHINDVAILEMEGQVPDHLYHPVKLVSQNFACETDLNGTLVGWGLTVSQKCTNKINFFFFN